MELTKFTYGAIATVRCHERYVDPHAFSMEDEESG